MHVAIETGVGACSLLVLHAFALSVAARRLLVIRTNADTTKIEAKESLSI